MGDVLRLQNEVEQLEKELAELQARKDSLDAEYVKSEKENTKLDNANTRLRESNFYLQKKIDGQSITITELQLNLVERDRTIEDLDIKLANQKYLNRQEVEKIFKSCREKPNIDIPQFHINAGKAITAICNLAVPEINRNKITAILVGKILETNKDAILIADEIISAIGGK